jgi:hypothetical protein
MRRVETGARLGVEGLEGRLLFAGNVTAGVSHGVLDIKGDATSNCVEIEQDETGITIRGCEDADGHATTVNGIAELRIEKKVRDINVGLGKGSDDLLLDSVNVRNLNIRTGVGDDSVSAFDMVISGKTLVDTGDGNDSVEISDSHFNKAATVNCGRGDDTVSVNSSEFAVHPKFLGGSGLDAYLNDGANEVKGPSPLSSFELRPDPLV